MHTEVTPPNDNEYRKLRKDAQEGVAGARAALGGDLEALKEWRKNNPDDYIQ